jgi:hypothetical protein
MFSKRHYEAIAAAMAGNRPGEHWDANKHVQWNGDVAALARAFKFDNASFKPSRFIAACGGYVGKDAELRS